MSKGRKGQAKNFAQGGSPSGREGFPTSIADAMPPLDETHVNREYVGDFHHSPVGWAFGRDRRTQLAIRDDTYQAPTVRPAGETMIPVLRQPKQDFPDGAPGGGVSPYRPGVGHGAAHRVLADQRFERVPQRLTDYLAQQSGPLSKYTMAATAAETLLGPQSPPGVFTDTTHRGSQFETMGQHIEDIISARSPSQTPGAPRGVTYAASPGPVSNKRLGQHR